MKTIPTLFRRDDTTYRVYEAITPGCEWVLAGEGIATRKWDGTACLIDLNQLYKRYDCKTGRTPPDGFRPCEDARDPETGHWHGWIPVGPGPDDRWHREAFEWLCERSYLDQIDGTWELCGPKIRGNPEGYPIHVLIRHGDAHLWNCPRHYEGLREYLWGSQIEGIVFHHPDKRMAKIKRRDFGFPWPLEAVMHRHNTGGDAGQ